VNMSMHSAAALPGGRGHVEERLLAALLAAGTEGFGRDELRRRSPWELTDELLDDVLGTLERRGEITHRSQKGGRWVAVEATPFEAGFLELMKDGDAVVRTPRGRHGGRPAASWFIASQRLKGALDGDRVLVHPKGRRLRRVGDRKLREAEVTKVLESPSDRLVGSLERDDDGAWWLVPYDPKSGLDVAIRDPGAGRDGDWVVATVEPTPTKGGGSGPPRGRILEVLGPSTEPGVDVQVALAHYRIPEAFSEEALAEAEALPAEPDPRHFEGRRDLRGDLLVTIDGPTARDFDDAVSVEELSGGRHRVGVHIADVSHYVAEGSALDLDAYHRGTSVYFPDRAVPMLPERLSNGLCSLRPHVPRLALSVFLVLDRDGEVVEKEFASTVIESKRRLTYDEVRRVLEEPAPGDADEYGPLLGLFERLRTVARTLNAKRAERGSLDFDLPEGDVILDTDGYMVGISARERHVAHRIIEEMMIAANEAVAEELDEREVPALYRVHDLPSPERLEELQETLQHFGFKIRGDFHDLPPAELQRVLREVEGRPQEEFVNNLVLRTLKRAAYEVECLGHYALASTYYTHFTSPIRRYPDLVVHRQLRRLATLGPKRARRESAEAFLPERLPVVAEHTSVTERRAERAERDVLQWKKVLFLAEHVGDRFRGIITGVQPFGFFVRLEPELVDGLVAIRTLEDDFYVFEPETHRLVGDNRGRVFQLGDEVEVILEAVDYLRRGLNLVVADLEEPQRREGRRGRNQRGR
jgi:ribonuclease R